MFDSLDVLQAPTTSTATTNGAWLDLNTQPGTEDDGLSAVFNLQAHSAVTPGGTAVFSLQYSTDGTNSLGTLGTSSVTMTPGTTPTNILGGVGYLEQVIPFIMPQAGQFVRAVLTIAAPTGVLAVSWSANLQWGGRNG